MSSEEAEQMDTIYETVSVESINGTDIEIRVKMATPKTFNDKCSSTNTEVEGDDSTGLRMYSASKLMFYLFRTFPNIFKNRRVVELGSGVGCLGIIMAKAFGGSIVCTEGSQATRLLAASNAEDAGMSEPRFCVRDLFWGEGSTLDALVTEMGAGSFEMVMGTDLFYYLTDPLALVHTIDALLAPNGVAMFAHICRAEGLEERLQAEAEGKGLVLRFIPVQRVLCDEKDQEEVHFWYSMHLLLLYRRSARRDAPWGDEEVVEGGAEAGEEETTVEGVLGCSEITEWLKVSVGSLAEVERIAEEEI